MQWISWLGGRWRTELNPWHNVNCRTHEHRHFERILRACARHRPTLVSGSVTQHPSGSSLVWSPALSGLQPWLSQPDQDVPCSVGLHPTLGVEKPGLVCQSPCEVRTCGELTATFIPYRRQTNLSSTWNQGGLPAEFKHINKRRKRKQLWFP